MDVQKLRTLMRHRRSSKGDATSGCHGCDMDLLRGPGVFVTRGAVKRTPEKSCGGTKSPEI